MQGLGCMRPVDWVDTKSRGFAKQTLQVDQDAPVEEVYIPEIWRNRTVNNAT